MGITVKAIRANFNRSAMHAGFSCPGAVACG
jgi:hypothetical protein